MRPINWESNGATRSKMAPRAVRREKIRELRRAAKKSGASKRERRDTHYFRPVYGHAIPAPEHKGTIQLMYAKDMVKSIEWMEKVVVGRALVAWGEALSSSKAVS